MACVTDTESINLTVTGGNLSADLILDPDPANAASVSASGVFVSGANETSWFDAGETWTALGADAPNFTFTILGDKTTKYLPGMRAKLTQASVKYFIIVAVSYDGGTGLTTVTVYGGTDYTLTGAAITNPFYSVGKVPTGFPADPVKWTEVLTDTADRAQASPSGTTWYNLGTLSITLPIGAWQVRFHVAAETVDAGGTIGIFSTLSTANNSETDTEFTSCIKIGGTPASAGGTQFVTKALTLAAKTVYYLNARSTGGGTSLNFRGATLHPTVVRAVSAYL